VEEGAQLLKHPCQHLKRVHVSRPRPLPGRFVALSLRASTAHFPQDCEGVTLMELEHGAWDNLQVPRPGAS
jgi:hypothetical protein